MTVLKCERCYRREVCSLRAMAELTLPWVAEALRGAGEDWEREQRVTRALRGCGESPGFVEDWRLSGALFHEDIAVIARLIAKSHEVTLAELCAHCRHYQGPVCEEGDWSVWAA